MFLRLNNILAAVEEVVDFHHSFGNFIDTKISLKKVQSILYTMIKKKNVRSYYFVGFLNYPRIYIKSESIFFVKISLLVTETVC